MGDGSVATRQRGHGRVRADVWSALPKVVFSRTLDRVQGSARLAEAPLAEEVAAALDATDKDIEIGGAGLASAALELGLVDDPIEPSRRLPLPDSPPHADHVREHDRLLL